MFTKQNPNKVIARLIFLLCFVLLPLQIKAQTADKNNLKSRDDKLLSQFTGYTRSHWIEITEKIIAGILPYFNKETGMPDLAETLECQTFEKIRLKNQKEEKKRALERIMMSVIIYNKATGKDYVPGYTGSITSPFIKAITKGTDPDDPFFWGDPEPNDQVGSSFAIGIYLSPEVFWDPLSPSQKRNILNYLQKQTFNKTYDNNHYLFHMLPVSLLEKNGFDANREHLTKMFDRLMGWYRGDGWFIDGNNGGFDYYNMWGFQLFYQILDRFDLNWHNQYGEQIKQVSTRFFETLPYLFGRDGSPIPWGRSLSYRFANVSFIGWSVLNGTCSLPPGQARRIASGSLKYFWEHGCLDDHNILNIGYWGTNASAAEGYVSPGDPYWATHGLACLLIPENDPFWTSNEEPIPADGAGGKLAVPGAQFSIRVSPIDGEARLFPASQPFSHKRNTWQTGIKYDQNSYSSYLGFCTTGEGGDETGAGRSGYSFDGTNWFFREAAKSILIEEDHLISRYTMISQPYYEITSHTLVGNDGEVYVFMHNYPEPIYMHFGGYSISTQNSESFKPIQTKTSIIINGNEYHSALKSFGEIQGILGFKYLLPQKDWEHTHLFGGHGVFPFWKSLNPVLPNTPVILYSNGTRNRDIIIPQINIVNSQGLLKIQFEGKWYEIKLPF